MWRSLPTMLALLSASSVQAQDPDAMRHARSLAATCANCHTATEQRQAVIPPLAGMSAHDIVDAVRAFRSGERQGTVMPQLAKGYTDAQIEAIAQWYAARKP